MNITENDIKVLGRVVSIAVDNVVADAQLVFDSRLNLNQETVNKNLFDAIQDAVTDITAQTGRISTLEQTVAGLSTQVAGKASTQDLQTAISSVREDVGMQISDLEESKLDVLTFDNVPTANSNNPVKSGGVYSKNQELASAIQQVNEDVDMLQQEVEEKQDALTFDNTPTAGSNNPVTSSGIKNAIDEIISYDSTDNRKTLESTYVLLTGHPCIYLTAGGEWPEDAGEIIIHSVEGDVSLIGDTYVRIRSGKQATVQSPIVGGHVNIETGGPISINGNPVTINGKNIVSVINNIFPNDSYSGSDRTTTPGLYLYLAGIDMNKFTPAVEEYTTGLLIVTHEHGIDDSTGDAWNKVCQLFMDMHGNKYSRRLSYTNSVEDIDWGNVPDFVLRS